MQTKKMGLANIQGKLSRTEMKNIMAGLVPIGGDDGPGCYKCCVGTNCSACVTSYEGAPCKEGTLTACPNQC